MRNDQNDPRRPRETGRPTGARPDGQCGPRVTPRLTMPLAPSHILQPGERLPMGEPGYTLDEAMRVTLWHPCERCRGQGTLEPIGNIICACHHTWTPDMLASYQGPHWRGKLPCGCHLDTSEVYYSYPDCPACGGAGWLPVLVTLTDALRWLLDTLYRVETDGETDGEVAALDVAQIPTARRRAM